MATVLRSVFHHLSAKHDSQFLKPFHTHNEIAGTNHFTMSVEDRNHLCTDPPHTVELIVAVCARTNLLVLLSVSSGRTLEDIVFDIAGYQMFSPYSLVPVFPGWR